MGLVRDFVEQVVEIVQTGDEPAQVGILDRGHARIGELMDLNALAVAVPVAVDAVEIVGGMERVIPPRVLLELHAVAFEEHHR